MDEGRFLNPRTFDPSRYADDLQTAAEAASNADPHKRDQYVFGAGRRICQGMHIAKRSLFLGIPRMLWTLNVEEKLDENSVEITPDIDALTQDLFVLPRPFPAKIPPRSEKHAQRVRQEWDDSQELLDGEQQWKAVPEGMAFSTYTPQDGDKV